MAADKRQIVVCSCEDTMPLDIDTLKRTCRGADITSGRQFCRSELDRFRKLATAQDAITVACTQEVPVFSEVGAETGNAAISFVNIRENAGWSKDAAKAGPKMAALLAAAAEPAADIPLVSFDSQGIILIYGTDETAIEAADLPKDIAPRRTTDFPVVQGTIRTAKGFLGQFEISVDDYAPPAPSSRATLSFGMPRNGATSH